MRKAGVGSVLSASCWLNLAVCVHGGINKLTDLGMGLFALVPVRTGP
jgi:hypothetical protein